MVILTIWSKINKLYNTIIKYYFFFSLINQFLTIIKKKKNIIIKLITLY